MVAVMAMGGVAWAEPMSAGPWAALTAPVESAPSSIGSAAAGCLTGAVALPDNTPGLQILRPQRNRVWSHPRTIAFLDQLGRQAQHQGLAPLLVGDLSQPRGGPMAYGHGSHQNGLDVDIWFRLPGKPLAAAERSNPVPVSMVRGRAVDTRHWGARQLKVLELAAASPEVDRIFVNPAIKAAACKTIRGDRAWLGKLRPWWGHDEHFHVRLTCTAGDVNCTPQAAVAAGDGCGAELSSWLVKSTILPDNGRDKPNTRRPDLPSVCANILDRPGAREASVR
ncbi:penicillin-insensitive murein endopeptidase [Magnetospirillum sulfuroxidans]|uniref:Penicillin-insensitive murein endopeptidase n=1 Tax=Magnetospirillum sulfuroxidans TaxID=611300 RepID=A0ABS5I8J4_9PROT|nr:penicillin-insensitive murein endopeptidase [Magnetospirillum sulfuroxidans]MBR9970639.1 penicillin-insensitive murein endopeptidase [Magnetospirillum sulfuroxidans]